VVRVTDVFPPLKSTAAGLLEVFERIDAVKDVQHEFQHLNEQFLKLVTMLNSYQGALSPEAKDRLDGLSRALEEKKKMLEGKLVRSIPERAVFATSDTNFITRVLREVTFAIEVTMLDMSVRSSVKLSQISEIISHMSDNAALDKLGHVSGAEFKHEDCQGCMAGTRVALLADLLT